MLKYFYRMKFLLSLADKVKKELGKTGGNTKEEQLFRLGREQFKSLVKRGLGIPVVLL